MQKGYTLSEHSESKGFAPILIILLIALGIGGYFIYTNYSNNRYKTNIQTQETTSQSTVTPSSSPDSQEIANWKTYSSSGISSGLAFQYPNNWNQDRFEVHKYTTQLYEGYTNQEWFNKIKNLKTNESFIDQREKRTKLASGNIASGEEYVIFKDEPSDSSQGESSSFIMSYILKSNAIYQITLNYIGTDMSAYSETAKNEATRIFQESIATTKIQ